MRKKTAWVEEIYDFRRSKLCHHSIESTISCQELTLDTS